MKIKKYKKIAAFSVIVTSILFSSACSSENASSDSTKEGEKEEISITYRSGGGSNKGLTDWLKKDVIPEF
ncbi:hypothetical protein [Peribacillus loiseleuriae]|uniref:hypothetical protein n=1 Tax=Peribacillus loiseleuriae TaxID=1679170 RepID=UPI00069E6427|nr:hypothetical protein [Peribacillus loiseleuriae]